MTPAPYPGCQQRLACASLLGEEFSSLRLCREEGVPGFSFRPTLPSPLLLSICMFLLC